MSRKTERSTDAELLFNEIAEVSSLLPLWATIPSALLLMYFVPVSDFAVLNFEDQTDFASSLVVYILLLFVKFFIPVALLAGALLSIIQKIRSHYLFGSIAKQGARTVIAELSWQDFEFLLFSWFKKQGYSAELTGGGGADGGVDIRLRKEGQLYLAQCKHYKVQTVPVTVVRELYGVMAAQGAVGGFVVTSGSFTSDAYKFAKDINVELIDGRKLVSILEASDLPQKQPHTSTDATCPKCGSKLTEKTGKYGKFLGCTAYPKCNFTKAYN